MLERDRHERTDHWRTYDFNFRLNVLCGRVVGQNGNAHHGEGAIGLGVVRVEVRQVGEVDGGRIVDGLQSAGSVEVADGLGVLSLLGLLSGGRALRLLDSSAEGARAGDLVG